MTHVSYTQLRANLTQYIDEVCESRGTLVVTRQNARSVVLLSEEQYRSIMEMFHLLRSPANADRLLRGVEEAQPGKLIEHALIEDEAGHVP